MEKKGYKKIGDKFLTKINSAHMNPYIHPVCIMCGTRNNDKKCVLEADTIRAGQLKWKHQLKMNTQIESLLFCHVIHLTYTTQFIFVGNIVPNSVPYHIDKVFFSIIIEFYDCEIVIVY